MLNRLYVFFFNTETSMKRYILRAAVVSLIPSLAVGALLVAVGLLSDENAPKQSLEDPVSIFFGAVAFAPLVETFLMAAGLWLLSFITERPFRLAALSAVLWAGLHSIFAPVWGLAIAWPFFVFSCAYLAWRRRAWWRAIFVTVSIHALHNLLPALGLAVLP